MGKTRFVKDLPRFAKDLPRFIAALVIHFTIFLPGIKPMCILTHMDNTHHGPARLEQTKKQAQLLTGCSPADVFCVTNYASETFHEENDPNLDVAVLRAVRHAVINATACVTRQHELRQEEAKKKIKAADFKEVMARGEQVCLI